MHLYHDAQNWDLQIVKLDPSDLKPNANCTIGVARNRFELSNEIRNFDFIRSVKIRLFGVD